MSSLLQKTQAVALRRFAKENRLALVVRSRTGPGASFAGSPYYAYLEDTAWSSSGGTEEEAVGRLAVALSENTLRVYASRGARSPYGVDRVIKVPCLTTPQHLPTDPFNQPYPLLP